ncbi:hypothetical protein [Nocardia sp. 348MFTsu5.1]|uniref:hypothetical protein n=1 Tax=Nocardia sp. 348MFTsu5.1 TaxID=1172185 RepID=UPI00037B9BBA|nr:hypothetical protein [Nocardia sp. 348MFTsu5.1]
MTRRHWITLWLTSATLSLVITAPFFRSGYLLIADMVSTPRSHLTDSAIGLGVGAPRAVPQDWFIALTSPVVDGGIIVKVLTTLALILTGVGYGRLVRVALPGSGSAGMLVGTTVAIWNPYVAERLLQGHWSLLFGYAAIAWIFLCANRIRRHPGYISYSVLAAWLAIAGLTPTGSMLALFTLVAALLVPVAVSCPHRIAAKTGGVALAIWVTSALPWIMASLLGSGSATSDPDSVAIFAARAEPGLGTFGSLLGLGGIWNADAVPASRTAVWAAVATAALLVVVAAGVPTLYRRRRNPPVAGAAGLATASIVLITLASTDPGIAVLEWAVDTVPGAGLLRDTQKWVALAVPLYALAAAAAVQASRRWVPRGFAAVVVAVLIVAPLPDLAWGVGNKVTVSTYPTDWQQVAGHIPADEGDVLLLPTGMNRLYDFTGHVSLDPAPRLLRADVLQTGELVVGGRAVDRTESRATAAESALLSGASPAELAELGVGWVLVEGRLAADSPARPTLDAATEVFDGEDLRVYWIEGARTVSASTIDRVAVWSAHLLWIVLIANGFVAIVLKWAHRSTHRKKVR